MSEQGSDARGANSLLPDLRSLAHLVTVNAHVDRVVENQDKLDAQLQQQDEHMADVLGALDQQNKRIAQITQELETNHAYLSQLSGTFSR